LNILTNLRHTVEKSLRQSKELTLSRNYTQ